MRPSVCAGTGDCDGDDDSDIVGMGREGRGGRVESAPREPKLISESGTENPTPKSPGTGSEGAETGGDATADWLMLSVCACMYDCASVE